MKNEIVIVDISPTGEVLIKTEGFEGSACIGATQELENSLGKVKAVKYTEEYKVSETMEHKNVIRRKQ